VQRLSRWIRYGAILFVACVLAIYAHHLDVARESRAAIHGALALHSRACREAPRTLATSDRLLSRR
jgi:hypothetical protein